MWGYFRKVFSTAEKWADENNLLKVDLCGGINPHKGYISYDLRNADIVGDLDEVWKLEDDSVGILRAWNALEHMKDPIHVMNEAYRVLAHGGFFLINVPSTDGRGAFQDPTHRSFWN
ncbi:MAG: methyltransferase domain-containing protein, partial [bacterium]